MKYSFTSLLFLLVISATLPAQQRWEATYQDGTYSDQVARMVQTANGDYLAYLISKETQNSAEFRYVGRIGDNGTLLDVDTSVQTYAGYPYPHLFPLANGQTRVINFWEDGGVSSMTKARFTPNFVHIWDGSVEVPFAGVPVMVDDSTFVVVRKNPNYANFSMMKITLSGNVIWQHNASLGGGSSTYSDTYHNLSVNACPDGGFYVSGFFKLLSGGYSYFGAVKFNSEGIAEWSTWEYLNGSVSKTASTGDAHYVVNYQLLRK